MTRSLAWLAKSLPVQQRLFKSLKLWSFYVDLEESIGTVETTKAVYDRIFELKIANAQVVINYANFLEENEYWEESFKVRGVPQRPLIALPMSAVAERYLGAQKAD